MTPEMVFECLIVSEDRQVLSLMNSALERLSIDVETCASPAEGLGLLAKRDIDLVVCDCKGTPTEVKLLNGVLNPDNKKRKPTVLTVVDGPFLALGAKGAAAHVVIEKPLTHESSAQGLKTAYSRMVREARRNPRRAIMRRVLAKNRRGELIQITITDVSEQGIGLFSKHNLVVGDFLSFDLALPNAERSLRAEIRLLWSRHNLAGADFERISIADRQFLHAWFASREKHDRRSKT
jgi:response regulator RpfG family c-di-GMP phosphodiesterase